MCVFRYYYSGLSTLLLHSRKTLVHFLLLLGASPSFADSLELPANRPMAEKTQSFLHNIHDQL